MFSLGSSPRNFCIIYFDFCNSPKWWETLHQCVALQKHHRVTGIEWVRSSRGVIDFPTRRWALTRCVAAGRDDTEHTNPLLAL